MGQYAYRLTLEAATSLRQDFSWIGFYIERIIQFLMSLVFLYGFVLLAYRIITLPLKLLFSLRLRKAFIKDIIVDPKAGASWFWWTYVTFVIGDNEKTFKLTPGQAVSLLIRKKVKEADSGELSYFANMLIRWRPFETSKSERPQVFISYSQENSGQATLVANVLKGRGLDVWKDTESLEVGESLPDEIEQSISESSIFLPLLSSEYFASKWCLKELKLACDNHPEAVLPIRISDEKLFIPEFVQEYLDKTGDPLALDLNAEEGLENLRELGDRISYGKVGMIPPDQA